MVRFFVTAGELSGEMLTLTGENAQHAKVLRLKEGEQVLVCDGAGMEALCTITGAAGNVWDLSVEEIRESTSEAAVSVSVYMAFPKADKLEHVIQKATELGAFEIVAFPSERCVSRPDDKALGKKLERWQKIAASAAEQSGRGMIPRVRCVGSFREAVEDAARKDLSVLLYENEEQFSLRQSLQNGDFSTVSLMTGPEGGFTADEVRQAQAAGLKICTLGPRILRCETAPLCALTAVLFAAGELD